MRNSDKQQLLLAREDQIRRCISKVLVFFRKDNLDIPFIARYRKFDYGPDLTSEDIWAIFALDQEYGRFRA